MYHFSEKFVNSLRAYVEFMQSILSDFNFSNILKISLEIYLFAKQIIL